MAIGVDGTFMIGNSGTGEFEQGALVAGENVTVTDLPGAIQIDVAAGGVLVDQFARDNGNTAAAAAQSARTKANGAVQTGYVTLNVAGQTDVVATSNNNTLTIVAGALVITTDPGNNTITIALAMV